MTGVSSEVHEVSAQVRVAQVPMAHVSIELGHLYHEDLNAGVDSMAAMFSATKNWAELAKRELVGGLSPDRVRASTCFLIDDYFSKVAAPSETIPMLLAAAEKAGLQIDYLMRESACAEIAPGISPAAVLLDQLIAEPTTGTTGSRPPVTETGWLTNGQRSPVTTGAEAMEGPLTWRPPRQTAARRHSIFVDVQLFDNDQRDGTRMWSCSMLAAVWQLLRLGLLRRAGQPLVSFAPEPERWPSAWAQLPPVVKLNPRAADFAAYRTFSLLPGRFLEVELATKTILGQFGADPVVMDLVLEKAAKERVPIPDEIVDRIGYGFITPGNADPV